MLASSSMSALCGYACWRDRASPIWRHGTWYGAWSVHFDFLYVGSSGHEGSEGLPEEDGFRYIWVIMDDLSNFVSLEPAEACAAEVSAKHLLNWCKTTGVPRV